MAKETNIRVRLSLEDKELLDRAAKAVHLEMTVSMWARGVLRAEALRILGLRETIGIAASIADTTATVKEVESTLTEADIKDIIQSNNARLPNHEELLERHRQAEKPTKTVADVLLPEVTKSVVNKMKIDAVLEKKPEPKESAIEKLKKDNPTLQSASEVIKWVKADLEEYPVIIVGEGKFKNMGGTVYFKLDGRTVGFDYGGGGTHYEVKGLGSVLRVVGNFHEMAGTITVTKK